MDQHEECTLVITDIPNDAQNVTIQISDASPSPSSTISSLPMTLTQSLTQGQSQGSSILVPGYLFVKSSSDSGTYQLQQTVMAIKVDPDNGTNTNCIDLPLTIPLEVTSEAQSATSGARETNTIINSATINNTATGTGMTTRSKTKKSWTITGKSINDPTNAIENITHVINSDNAIANANVKLININNNGKGSKLTGKLSTRGRMPFSITTDKTDNNQKRKLTNDIQVIEQFQSVRQCDADISGAEIAVQGVEYTEIGSHKPEKRVPPSRLVRVNCPVCSKEFKKTYLKEHMKIHEEEKPYKCTVCGKRYRWRTLLRNHKKTHLTNNPFTCPVCELRMSSKFSVQQHILKVHENAEKKFHCTKCSKKYVTIHQLKAHEKFHSEDRTRQCEYCGKVYKHIASLERHRRIHKGEESSLDLRLKCSTCGLICHSKTHYTAHQRIHTGEKPFICETCGKSYRQIAQLNQHKIVHTDLRPFKCTLCERTFRCRSNLQLHLDHHKGEKRHSCSHCGQKFFSYPNMLKHVRRNHLNLRPHKCELCDKSFCEKQELQNHMRTHTGEKRPTPKRKRLPLPTPDGEEHQQLEQTILVKMESVQSSGTTFTIVHTDTGQSSNHQYADIIEPAIIYEINNNEN